MKTKSRSIFNMSTLIALVASLLGGALSATTAHALPVTCYVDVNAAGTPDGSSWTDAYTDLEEALMQTGPICNNIYVAQGVYKPDNSSAGNAFLSFNVHFGQAVYGGFASGDAFVDRDPATKVTILTGDIGADDTNTDGNQIDETYSDRFGTNSENVVYLSGTSAAITPSDALLDGFTITGGNASFGGGGLLCFGSVGECSPTLSNLTFSGNYASYGGAIMNQATGGGASSPALNNVTFGGNGASAWGGAVYNWGNGGVSSPSFTNVTFSGNTADSGGAIANDGCCSGTSNPSLTNVTFSGNSANAGGAMYSVGNGGTSSPALTNVTFYGNSAGFGGAMYNNGFAGTSSPSLTNVTFNGNTATTLGGALFDDGGSGGASSPALTNVILWGDTAPGLGGPEIYDDLATPTINHSVVQGGDGGSNTGTAFSDDATNVSTNPKLDPSGPAENGGTTKTIALLPGSSAVDAGTTCTANDQRGLARPVNSVCDIGAYESPTEASAAPCRVDASGSGTPGGGASWSDPYIHLQAALANTACSEVWVADGLYTPGSHVSDSFTVPPGVRVYGGFAGGEGAREARMPATNVAVLSGDIGDNDTNKTGNGVTPTAGDIVGSNAYHVVKMDGTASTIAFSTVLDGFTLSAGKATGVSYVDGFGGGLLCDGRGGTCSPTLSQLAVIGNAAGSGGGMMFLGESSGISSPALRDVTFARNAATASGGGIYNGGNAGESSPALTNVTFSDNSAASLGGAMMSDGTAAGNSHGKLANVTFSGNSANYGGAMYNRGAGSGDSSPELMNVTFNGNSTSGNGGAVYNDGTVGGNSSPAFTNVILWGDTGGSGANEMVNDGTASPTINYSVVEGGDSGSNTGTAFSSGSHNTSDDPMLAALASNGGYTKTMQLLSTSSAIETGDPNVCAAPPVKGFDQRGVSRMTCDIGAYQVELGNAHDDNAASWIFTGSWMMSPSPGAYNNTLHLARSAGATASYDLFAAAGNRFVVTYLRKPGLGNLEVYLDASVTPLITIATAGPARLLSYVSPALTAGLHTVKLRRAGAGVVGFDLLELIIAKGDDRSPGITYAGGGWTNVAAGSAYMGTLKYATVTNATASFGFTGSRFSVTAAKSPGFGTLEVYVDGDPTPLATLNYDATPVVYWTYTSPTVGFGAHTVELKYVSASPSYVALDSFVIRP